MRKFFASIGVLAIASTASAQIIDLTPMQTVGYEDGNGEVAWKIANPSGASDWFSVDFGADASGATMAGLWADSAVIGSNGGAQQIGTAVTGGGGFPDTGTAIMQSAAVPPTDGFNSDTGYGTACMDPGSDFHVVYNMTPGDTEVWLVSDTDGATSGRSFFSSDSYTTGAAAFFNWRMGYAGYPFPIDGTLLVNGGIAASISNTDDICMTFSACASGVGSAFYLCTPIFFGPLLPAAFTTTGGIIGGPCSNQWTICTTLTCADPTGGPFGFCCIYLDPCDVKTFNGKPKSKVSTTATLVITPDGTCGGCYGQLDDGIVDFYIWKVQNPAGTGDWFNVNHGAPAPASGVTTLTGVQVSSWDFCGFGPCWASVGIYADNGSGSPTGAAFPAANPCMAPGAADGGPYPMTMYDTPDTPAAAATAWHVASNWPVGDSCIWLGSDTDGTDSTCGTPIPSAGTTSGFASDNYASGTVGFSAGNWAMKIDWT